MYNVYIYIGTNSQQNKVRMYTSTLNIVFGIIPKFGKFKRGVWRKSYIGIECMRLFVINYALYFYQLYNVGKRNFCWFKFRVGGKLE